MRLPLLPVMILALPILEIAGFVLVGKAAGLWATLGLVILSSVAGAMLLRSGGAGLLQKMAAAQRDPSRQAEFVGAGFTRMLSGLLLIIPGFVTSLAGLLLLVPGFGAGLMRIFGAKVASSASFRAFTHYHNARPSDDRPQTSGVVDLDTDEYTRQNDEEHPENRSPWSGTNLPDKRL